MKLPRSVKRLTSGPILAAFAALSALVLTAGPVYAANVQMEGAIYAKNITNGTDYARAGTSAKAGDQVGIEVYYHNQEAPDSGLNANNVRIKVNLPGDSGTSHTVSAAIKADNSNQVDTSTAVTSSSATQLEFIPGSVTWRHNTGTNDAPNWVTQGIGDEVVTSANGAIVEQTEKPCNNFAATIAFKVKIVGQEQPPAPQPTYACTLLDIEAKEDKTVKITAFTTSQTNGATFKNAVITWGDNSSPTTTANVVGQTHQYDKFGTYTISATAHFDVNGKDVTSGGPACAKSVTFKEKAPPVVTTVTTPSAPSAPSAPTPSAAGPAPTTLVNTGPGEMAALFAVTTALGAFGYRRMLSRTLE